MNKISLRSILILLTMVTSQIVLSQYVMTRKTFGVLTEVHVGKEMLDGDSKQGVWEVYYTPWSPEFEEAHDKKVEGRKEQEQKMGLNTYLTSASDYYSRPEYSEEIAQNFIDQKLYLQQPVKSVATYKKGIKDGLQFEFDTEGVLLEQAHYVDGKELLYMSFENGKLKMSLQVKSDNIKEKILYYPNGDPEQKFYYEGTSKEGPFKSFYDTGETYMIAQYVNDMLSGEYTKYFKNGDLLEIGNYINGDIQGEVRTFYQGGNVESLGNYYNGVLYGPITHYYKDGTVQMNQEYKNGVRWNALDFFLADGTQTMTKGTGKMIYYYDNGNKEFESNYKNGARNGLTTWYHDNGQIDQEVIYKNDINEGADGLRWEIVSSFDKEGNPREKGTLKNGNGTWIIFDEDGSKSIMTYKEGKKVDN